MPTLTRKKSLDGEHSTTPFLEKNPWVLHPDNIATAIEHDLDEPIPGITLGHSEIREVELTAETYKTLNIAPGKKLLHKTDPHPDRNYSQYSLNPLQIEVAGTNFFRLLSAEHCSCSYLIVNPSTGIADSCVIERILGFQTIDQIHTQRDLKLKKEELLKRGIAPVLIYNFLLQNNDFRNGNMGLNDDGNFVAIDFDQALWSYPTSALFDKPLDPENAEPISQGERFPLTLQDLQNFPVIKDAKPTHWPARDITPYNPDSPQDQRDKDFADLLKSLKDDPDFLEQKYFCLFKFCILFQYKSLIAQELEKTMHPDSTPFKVIVDGMHNRALQLQYLLLADEKFEPYLSQIEKWYTQIKSETMTTYLHLENDHDETFAKFYNTYAIRATEGKTTLIYHANDAAEQTQRSPERKISLNRSQIRSEESRESFTILANRLSQLLEKHKKYAAKIEKSKKPHKDTQTLEFCRKVQEASSNFEVQTLGELFAAPPKIKRGFFNWFGSSQLEDSVAKLMKTQNYQTAARYALKMRSL